jgi:nucleoside-diphosphate-sugar epimerase
MAEWLVTGGSGFIGRHTLEALLPCGEVVALGRRCPSGWDPRRFVFADLERPETIDRALELVKPDRVIHAAGKTPPADAEQLYRANAHASRNLIDALQALGRPVRLVLVGSAAELGPVTEDALPVREEHPCHPADAYGMSKWMATIAGLSARPPLEVVNARVFNPIGPGQPTSQVLGRFTERLLSGEPGPLIVGNIEARRDFIDVRDVARALVALALNGSAGCVYHVGTGRSHSVRDGIERLIRASGRSVAIRVDPGLSANGGPRDSRANIERIVADTGWRPQIEWERSLGDLWQAAHAARRLPLTA